MAQSFFYDLQHLVLVEYNAGLNDKFGEPLSNKYNLVDKLVENYKIENGNIYCNCPFCNSKDFSFEIYQGEKISCTEFSCSNCDIWGDALLFFDANYVAHKTKLPTTIAVEMRPYEEIKIAKVKEIENEN